MGFRMENIFLISGDFLKSKVKVKPSPKIEEHFFQTTIDMHIQNPHKTVGGPLLAALAAEMCSLLLPNCEGSHSSCAFIFKYFGTSTGLHLLILKTISSRLVQLKDGQIYDQRL